MSELKELHKRIIALEDIEAIRKLKAKYCRCNDMKQWDEIGDCFAEDAILEPAPDIRVEGREEIVKFLEENLDSTIVVHQVHQAEIEITGESTAKAIWGEYAEVTYSEVQSSVAYGFYNEEYIKEGGCWRIKYERIDRIYQRNTVLQLPV